jgi:UDP-N-acetylglucosamine 1-carboxyvinyltransferase
LKEAVGWQEAAVEGNKNSALPLLAACLLTSEECVLSNVPRIRDVEVLVELMRGIGAHIDGAGTPTLRVRCDAITTDRPDRVLVGRLRGSVLLLGPLLGRRGSARLAQPGGDFPARRRSRRTCRLWPQWVRFLRAAMSRRVMRSMRRGACRARRSIWTRHLSRGPRAALLAAAARARATEIRHAAMEPHVVELCRFLRAMGVSIEGEGTPTIRVEVRGYVAFSTGSTAITSRLEAGGSSPR